MLKGIKIPLLLKLGASGLLLALVISRVDLASLFESLSKSNIYFVLAATTVAFVGSFITVLKWRILLVSPVTNLSYPKLLRLNFIGLFYNLVLPGQIGGEVLKGVVLSQMGVSKVSAAMSILADRVTGLAALFALSMLGALLAPAVIGQPSLLPWVLSIGCLSAVMAVILVTARGQALVLTFGNKVLHLANLIPRKPNWLPLNISVPEHNVSSIWTPLALSVLAQAAIVYANLLLCFALGISVTYPQLLWVVAVVSLLQSLPISIAGIGVREGAYVYLLQLQGVAGPSALALSLTVFAIQVLMASVGGLLQLQSLLKRKSVPLLAATHADVEVTSHERC